MEKQMKPAIGYSKGCAKMVNEALNCYIATGYIHIR